MAKKKAAAAPTNSLSAINAPSVAAALQQQMSAIQAATPQAYGFSMPSPAPAPAPAPAPPIQTAPPPQAPQGASYGQPIFAQTQPTQNTFNPNTQTTPIQDTGVQQTNQGVQQAQSGAPTAQQAVGATNQAAPIIQSAVSAANQASPLINAAGGLQNQAIGQINQATNNTGGLLNTGNSQLQNILAGNNLNPASNPYLAQMANAANQNVVNSYETAVAPTLMAQAQMAAGGGPGQNLNNNSAFQQSSLVNEEALGSTLANNTANIYGNNYANAQNQITSALGEESGVLGNNYQGANQLQNAASGLLGTAGTQLNQGGALGSLAGTQQNQGSTLGSLAGTQAGIGNIVGNLGATQFGEGTQQYNQLENSINQLMGVGSLQQQQQQTGLNAGTANAGAASQYPLSLLSSFGGLLSQATGGLGSQFQVGTTQK